jgi:hypothetical protein
MNHTITLSTKEVEMLLLVRQILLRCGDFPCDILLQKRNGQFIVRETKRPERLPSDVDKMIQVTDNVG